MPQKKGGGSGICIVAHYAYGALTGGTTGQLGGVERQTSMLAKWLAASGHKVSLITWDEGQSDDCVVDGVRVIKTCAVRAGVPSLRFISPRWTSLTRALAKADAELYYQNCGEHITGQVALWCKRNGRKFIFSSAHDFDCDYKCPGLASTRDKVLLRYGLRHADKLIVQTQTQQRALQQGYGLDSIILPMPCPGNDSLSFVPPAFSEDSPRVLWVGRIAPIKRLEWLLDIALQLPLAKFDVAGVPDQDTAYARMTLERARAIPNVVLHGRVPRSKMPALYDAASLLCSTSISEGFPNTFLEAWSFGKPVVSTFDPDHLIAHQRLGAVVGDTDSLIEALGNLLRNRAEWEACSRRCRNYYMNNHTVDDVMSRFERSFSETLDHPAPSFHSTANSTSASGLQSRG